MRNLIARAARRARALFSMPASQCESASTPAPAPAPVVRAPAPAYPYHVTLGAHGIDFVPRENAPAVGDVYVDAFSQGVGALTEVVSKGLVRLQYPNGYSWKAYAFNLRTPTPAERRRYDLAAQAWWCRHQA
ncbi:hypothetical protein GCM10010218_30450 [Streptomyces mashuensis]|uniref:Uncharacterized protein n=1 Tax=Streptomyces mashuensis TaxID=33904 RepID=A0A919B2X5_9ACTN|nr:hypothetical protein [Streptomyces mashuensis]GHF47068.1 hypothetical protein GCM10010218_30450 [Streptomyces mashuensis]